MYELEWNRGMVLRGCGVFVIWIYIARKKRKKKSWHTDDDYQYDNVDRFVKKAKAMEASFAYL